MVKQIEIPQAFEIGFLEVNKRRQQQGLRPLTKKRVLEIILENVFPGGEPDKGNYSQILKLLFAE